MGKGRRPLPTAVKKLRGNPGKRKLPAAGAEPTPAAKDPAKPASLSPIAAKEWDDIVPILREMKVLTEADGKALAAYCHNFARWVQAEEEMSGVDAEGKGTHRIIIEEPIVKRETTFHHGKAVVTEEIVGYKIKKHPANSISEKAQQLMKSFLVEFGLTPASRAKLRIEKPAEADPFEAYLAGKSLSGGDVLPN